MTDSIATGLATRHTTLVRRSANHHYIPQMIIRRFCRSNGQLWYFNCNHPESGIKLRNPKSIFKRRHINSYVHEDGKRNDALEMRFFSRLDNDANRLINEIERILLSGKLPLMNDATRKFWDQFIYNYWSRTPDFHEFQDIFKQPEKFVRELIDEGEQSGIVVSDAEREETLSSSSIARIVQNARVMALARQSERVLQEFSKKNLVWGIVKNKKKQFILGSKPIIVIRDSTNTRLSAPKTRIWTPLTPRIVAGYYGAGGDDKMVRVADGYVRAINISLFRQSSSVGSASKEVIANLATSI